MNIHYYAAGTHTLAVQTNMSFLGRLSAPSSVVETKKYMIEMAGFCHVTCATPSILPIPVFVNEENGYTLSSGWADSAVSNPMKLLPLDVCAQMTGGIVSSFYAKVVVDTTADNSDNILCGWILQNGSTGSKDIIEANMSLSARYAIERIPTYEREF